MTGTRRTPIKRSWAPQITPTAIKLFEQMRRCRCTCSPNSEDCPGCKRWWDLHDHLSHELHCKPWNFPAIEDPRTPNPYPPGTHAHMTWEPDREAQEMWRALDAASREVRRE